MALARRAEADGVSQEVREAAETKQDLIAAIVSHAKGQAGGAAEPEEQGAGTPGAGGKVDDHTGRSDRFAMPEVDVKGTLRYVHRTPHAHVHG